MSQDKKNMILFFTDQQRQDTLGVYGNQQSKTENEDQLAAEGCTFNQAYTPTAICTPARASLITGLMPHKHSLLANFERNVGYPTELDPELKPFSENLKEAGYRVANIGKWHVSPESGPEKYGFEGSHYPGWKAPTDHPEYLKYLKENELPEWEVENKIVGQTPGGREFVVGGIYQGPVEGTFPYFLAEKVIEKIENCQDSKDNFFISCNFFGPHLPYLIPAEYANMYDPAEIELTETMKEEFKAKPEVEKHYSKYWGFDSFDEASWRKIIAMYWGFTTLIDEQIGRVVEALKEKGLYQETVLFFTADHGGFVGSHKMQDKGPAMYDDIYQIPLIISSPEAEKNIETDQFVSLIDLTATFLEIAGAEVPSEYDGRSLLPLLRGENPADWRQQIFAEFHGHQFPYPQRMIRTKDYKLVVNPPDTDVFYDLKNDPNEMKNEINNPEYEEIRKELYQRLFDYLKENGDNFYHWMAAMYELA